jgi:hypothetical protein
MLYASSSSCPSRFLSALSFLLQTFFPSSKSFLRSHTYTHPICSNIVSYTHPIHTHTRTYPTPSNPLSHTHLLSLPPPPPLHTQACYPIFSKDPNFRGMRADRNYPQNWKNPPLKSLFNGEIKEEGDGDGEGATVESPEGSYAQDGSYAQEGTYLHMYVVCCVCVVCMCVLITSLWWCVPLFSSVPHHVLLYLT